jgi:hypothetical protein
MAAPTHSGRGWTYAPRPGAAPPGSTETIPPAGARTTRRRRALGSRRPQPTQVRVGRAGTDAHPSDETPASPGTGSTADPSPAASGSSLV